VTIEFPPGRSTTGAATIAVRGRAADPDGIADVIVNGVPAATTDGFVTWRARVPVGPGENVIVVRAVDSKGTADAVAASVTVANEGAVIAGVNGLVMDESRRRLVVLNGGDLSTYGLVTLDVETGRAAVLSDETRGTGPLFDQLGGFDIDAVHDRVIAVDWVNDALLGVSLSTGDRTVVSPKGSAGPTEFYLVGATAVDSTGSRAFVSTSRQNTQAIVEVDLGTGQRRVVTSTAVGSGVPLEGLSGMSYDDVTTPAKPRLIASAGAPGRILTIDIATGAREVLPGSGWPLRYPGRPRLDAARRRVVVPDGSVDGDFVVAVDLATGARSLLGGGDVGRGVALSRLTSVALDRGTGTIYAGCRSLDQVVAIDGTTLERTLAIRSHVGSGRSAQDMAAVAVRGRSDGSPSLWVGSRASGVLRVDLDTGSRTELAPAGPAFQGMAFDALSITGVPRLVAVDSGRGAVIAIDTANGRLTDLASASRGSGPALLSPRGLTLHASKKQAFVMDSLPGPSTAVFSVDLQNGNRTRVSGASRGAGTTLYLPVGLALDDIGDPGASRILVTTYGEPSHGSGLVAINESTGNRRMLSSYAGEAGTGAPFRGPHAVVLDRSNRRALVTDGLAGLVGVDLGSGNRTLISGTYPPAGIRGEGPANFDPAAIDVDAPAGVAYVVDWEHGALLAVDLVSGDRTIVAR
jgi:hypothetical protein